MTAYVLRGYGGGPIYVAAFLALVSVVIVADRRVWIACAATGALSLSVAAVISDGWSWSTAVFATIWLVGAGLVGEAVRARRGQEAALAERAAEAERTRDEEARRRAAEERLRLAREIHDVVGHSLAVISLQAGVAAHLLQTRPQQAREAVAAIRKVSSEALDDLRAELGLLRDPDGAPPAPAPVAGLEAVPALVASLREAGVPVELDDACAHNGAAPLPDAVSAAGYRIIREALTNVARHAGAGARAHVRVARGEQALEVEVVDDGAGPGDGDGGEPAGSGIAGMRERAAALGGRLEAGAGEDGGFRVWASLPAHASPPRGHEHPRRARRRPGARARRPARADRRRGRHRGRRRGDRRRAGGRRRAQPPARRRADGHPHAGHRRPRGDAPDRRRRRAAPACAC